MNNTNKQRNYQTNAQLKDRAKDLLTGKYGKSILVNFLPTLIRSFLLSIPFSIISSGLAFLLSRGDLNATDSPAYYAFSYPLELISSVFVTMFSAGIALYYLNIACGKKYAVSDIFFGFRFQVKKVIAISVIFTLIDVICLLPFRVIYSMLRFHKLPINVSWGITCAMLYLLGYLLIIVFSLMLSQTFYLLLDFPQYTTGQLLRTSIHVMKGNMGRLLWLNISFIPITLLSVLSIVGILWLLPYTTMTRTLFFLDLMNPQASESL